MYKVATDCIFLCSNILTEQPYTLRLYKSGFLDNIGDGASDEHHIHHECDQYHVFSYKFNFGENKIFIFIIFGTAFL